MANAGKDIENSTEEGDPFQYAMRRINEAWTAETENFDNGRDDQRFYAGEQWNPDARQDRTESNRPVITINRLPGFIRQVTGDARKNTPAIKVAPAKDGASEEVAQIYNGLIRNIEVQSNAKAAYVQALENSCVTGLGSFQIITQYSADDAFDQDIRIKRLPDPFQVLYDPAAREPDKSDGRFVAVLYPIPKETYNKQFPDAPMDGMPTGPNAIQGITWFSMNAIMVAEYWYKKPVKKKLYLLDDGETIDDPKKLNGRQVKQERLVDSHKVCMRLMNGNDFLTKEVDWAGRYLPICPVIGEEIYIEGRVVRRGMVRDAKDAQRVYNYMRTAAVEAAALQPKAPWVGTVSMFKGLEKWWKAAGSKNLPYLTYNPDPKSPTAKPERAQPAIAQTGLDEQAQVSAGDLQAVVGVYNVSLGAPSNETSGRAINARNAQADTGTFNYIDNLATALQYAGRILVDLIPRIYDTERVVRVLKEDGSHDMVTINQQNPAVMGMDPQALKEQQLINMFNDLSVGEYDVTVVTGPSFATRRQEAAANMTDLVRNAPSLMGIAGDLLIKNMDFPGAEEIAARIKRTMPPQVTGEEPDPNAPPPQPDPKMVAEMQESQANTAKAVAQTKLFEAQAEQAASMAAVNMSKVDETRLGNIEAMLQSLLGGGVGQALGVPQQQGAAQPPVDPRAEMQADRAHQIKMRDFDLKEREQNMKARELGMKALQPQQSDMGELEPVGGEQSPQGTSLPDPIAELSEAIAQQGKAIGQGMTAMGEGLGKLAQAVMAEQEIVRGPDGKVAGARKRIVQ
jgi:hypothetical protein